MDGAGFLGERMLGEVEEGTLDEILTTLRKTLSPTTTTLQTSIPPLDALITAANTRTTTTPPHLSLTGRFLPFLHALISHLVTTQTQTVLVIDPFHLFDPTLLLASAARHVYVFRPAPPTAPPQPPMNGGKVPERELEAEIRRAREWMIYSGRCGSESRMREFWGTVVVGGRGGDVSSGWRGWARVERAEGDGFPVGVSVEEVMGRREADARDGGSKNGWVVRSKWGGFWFGEAGFGKMHVEAEAEAEEEGHVQEGEDEEERHVEQDQEEARQGNEEKKQSA